MAVLCWTIQAAMRLMLNYFHHLLFLDAHIDGRTDSQTQLLLYE